MRYLISLVGLMLVGCGGGSGSEYTACQFEAGGKMQETVTGVAYVVDGLSCTVQSLDRPGAECGTHATMTPSALSYGPVTLNLNVTTEKPMAGCMPSGQYACQRTFDGGVTYDCGAQGTFKFQFVK